MFEIKVESAARAGEGSGGMDCNRRRSTAVILRVGYLPGAETEERAPPPLLLLTCGGTTRTPEEDPVLYFKTLPAPTSARQCPAGCGKSEQICPKHIYGRIPQRLGKLATRRATQQRR